MPQFKFQDQISKFDKNTQNFFQAVVNNNLKALKETLKKGVDVNIKLLNGGKTALHLSTELGHYQIVEELINNQADVSSITDRGFSPLHVVAQKDNKDISLLLIKSNAKLDIVSDNGMGTTALQEAAYMGNIEIVKILLMSGADSEYREKKYNYSAFDLADKAGHKEVKIELLGYKRAFTTRVFNIIREYHSKTSNDISDFFENEDLLGVDHNSKSLLKDVKNKKQKYREYVKSSMLNITEKWHINNLQREYYNNLLSIVGNEGYDGFFEELRTKLKENYEEVKQYPDIQNLRRSLIELMKQYNADKILEYKIKEDSKDFNNNRSTFIQNHISNDSLNKVQTR